jgi:hypothetical protein
MEVKSSIELFKELQKNDLCFAYSGSFFDSITHKIIDLTQHNIDSSGNFVKIKNKISFLMAECYQNVVRHGKTAVDYENDIDKSSAFFVRSIGTSFYITSANLVLNSTIDTIKEKLDKVNSLSQDELRLLQKQVLAKGKLSEKGGAGLGIIEMARRTDQKINYDFERINDTSSMFYLQLKIKSVDEENKTSSVDISLDDMKILHQKMVSDNVLILHKGDFAEHSVLPVIQMIEKNLQKHADPHSGKQRLYNISVELLQNISMHAYKSNGTNEALFVLGKHNEHFYISTANYVELGKCEKLKVQIEELKGMNKNELNELYRQKLQLVIDEKAGGAGIGLIYIFRKCSSIDFSIKPESNKGLFSLVVNV